MKFYSIGELDIIDPGWLAAYVQNVTPMVEHYGGRYLTRTSRIEQLEGERKPPQIGLEVNPRGQGPRGYGSAARPLACI